MEPSPQPQRRFTTEEVHHMVQTGVLSEDEPLELVDGVLYVCSPQGSPHAAVMFALEYQLNAVYGEAFHTRTQTPLTLGPYDEPEPDLAVVRGRPLDYFDRHPGPADAVLVIEVVHTARHEAERKIGRYAAAGVPELWLLDLPRRVLRVFREPSAEGYRGLVELGPAATVTPPGTTVQWPIQTLLGPRLPPLTTKDSP